MNTILTSAGRLHHLDGVEVWAPYNVSTVREIAHALAQINRFTGHCARPYSVAEHSLLVADIVHATHQGINHNRVEVELAALLHDAHESVTGDAASPIKRVLGQAWEWFEDEQQNALLDGYDLLTAYQKHRHVIKQADLIALATERRDLMPWTKHGSEPWDVLDKAGEQVEPWPHVNLNNIARRMAPWWWWRRQFEARVHGLAGLVAAYQAVSKP